MDHTSQNYNFKDMIHVDLLTFFILHSYRARQKQAWQIAKHSDFDLTCDVIGDLEVNDVEFPLTMFASLSYAV